MQNAEADPGRHVAEQTSDALAAKAGVCKHFVRKLGSFAGQQTAVPGVKS